MVSLVDFGSSCYRQILGKAGGVSEGKTQPAVVNDGYTGVIE